jgi:pimeloyl-ACP methyl ester carboxylesterase
LVVWGELDDLVPSRHARVVQDNVAKARVEIFENAGHDPMVVNPERFNRVIAQFLEDDTA